MNSSMSSLVAPKLPKPAEIVIVLQALEDDLKRLDLWQNNRPSAEDLESIEPFCIDTLTLPQWLQFILIEKLLMLIQSDNPLPTQCGVAAMAEEYFSACPEDGRSVCELLRRLDVELSQSSLEWMP